MDPQPTSTRILPAHECWALLRTAPFGRLALCVDDRPEVFPINFVVDHGSLVYRTSEGTKSSAAEKAASALEADGRLAPGTTEWVGDQEMMWSVVVKGHTSTIGITAELMDTVQLPLHPWESGRKDRFMRLVPDSISGRAFVPSVVRAAASPEQVGQ